MTQTIDITALSHEGRGIGKTPKGKTVLVEGALPLERVSYRRLRSHARFEEGVALDIQQPNPIRQTPPCPYAASVCGGCSLQHLSVSEQLAHKTRTVAEQLEHFGGQSDFEWVAPLVGPSLGYRRKARLGVKYLPDKGVIIGFREKGGRLLANVDGCPVLMPVIGERLSELKTLIAGLEAKEAIPQIEVAVGDRQAALVFRHLVDLNEADKARLRDFGEATGIQIYLQPKGLASTYLLYPESTEEGLYYSLPDYGIRLDFHPQDFIQVNTFLNAPLVKQALDWLDIQKTDKVLDLFCGLGNFSLPMASLAKSLIGVEGDAKMVEKAKENARKNGLENTQFWVWDLFKNPDKAPFAAGTYDKILIDPPRSGAAPILPWVKAQKPRKLVYVSCQPATLAKDARLLCEDGKYRLRQVGLADLFPHTSHVESMALFEAVD